MLSVLLSLLLAVSVTYSPPVAYEMSLAGNFGEPRPNHFHGGIDVKTDGVVGKPLRAIADGYVSRITVGLLGFGNALYITHPDGHTSVYCHLQSFAPRIERLLQRWQYEHQSYAADVRLSPLDYPVARGQFVAVSGNSGASQAPHLHLEVHDTRTGNMLDPLDFLGIYVNDGLPPMAHGFMAYPVKGLGVFNGGSAKQTFGFGSHHLSRRFTAWGKVGFALWANDYMEITYNRYGVRETTLKVDGRVVFRSVVDNIPQQRNRMVNSWGDYEHFMRYGVWYMKSFIEPGNTLPMLEASDGSGYIDFNEQRDYHLQYELKDFKGNTSSYDFTVTGTPTALPKPSPSKPFSKMLHNRISTFTQPGMQLVLPNGVLPYDIELHPTVQSRADGLSPSYAFQSRSFPLFNWAELSIAVRGKVADPSKLYITSDLWAARFCGGSYKNGWVTGRIRELGAHYRLEYDDRPPVITPVAQGRWSSTRTIRIGLADSGSGLKSYNGFIDGRFVLFKHLEKSPWVECRLAETPMFKTVQTATDKPKREHRLRFIATDNCNNTSTFETIIR